MNNGSRLIETEHARPVHESTSHRQTLTPATGELASTPVDVRLQMRRGNHFLAPLVQFVTAQAIKFSCKNKVLIHSQLVVEREFLRHVADQFLDRFKIPNDVVPADSRRAFGRLQNAAEHPNHSCFSRTVWAEETEDRSFSDAK